MSSPLVNLHFQNEADVWIWFSVTKPLIKTVPKLFISLLEDNPNWLMFILLKSITRIHSLSQCRNKSIQVDLLLIILLTTILCTEILASHIIFEISVSVYGNVNPRNRITTIWKIVTVSSNSIPTKFLIKQVHLHILGYRLSFWLSFTSIILYTQLLLTAKSPLSLWQRLSQAILAF